MTRHATLAYSPPGSRRHLRGKSCVFFGAFGDAHAVWGRPLCLPRQVTPGKMSSNGHDSRRCVRKGTCASCLLSSGHGTLDYQLWFCLPSPPLFFPSSCDASWFDSPHSEPVETVPLVGTVGKSSGGLGLKRWGETNIAETFSGLKGTNI